MHKQILKIRIFLWLSLFSIVFFLLYKGIIPSGHILYKTDFLSDSFFIGKLSPQERVYSIDDKNPNIIFGDPVYFSLYTPRKFNTAKLKYRYRRLQPQGIDNFLSAPIIETGVLVDNTIWRYDLRPVENLMIDSLSESWEVTRKDNLVLYQRGVTDSSVNRRFSSISDFFEETPNLSKVALYNYDLKKNYTLDNYESLSSEENKVSYSLRGPYQFYTYIDNEDLDFNFEFVDLNKNRDSDAIDIHLYYQDKLIVSEHLDDDGIITDNGVKGEVRNKNISLKNLPKGTYKFELRVNDDIVTKKIGTKQKMISFVNKVWLVEEGLENISLWTDGDILQVKTVNPGSLQTLAVGRNNLVVSETYKQFETEVKKKSAFDRYAEIKVEKDGLILAGNGVFSFREESLFNPKFKKVDANLNFDKDNIHYVLAEYKSPLKDDDWREAEVELDLRGAYREDGKYNFIISIPGIEQSGTYVEFDSIEVDLFGRSLWEKIFE